MVLIRIAKIDSGNRNPRDGNLSFDNNYINLGTVNFNNKYIS